jgi:RHS repeat-associated protein
MNSMKKFACSLDDCSIALKQRGTRAAAVMRRVGAFLALVLVALGTMPGRVQAETVTYYYGNPQGTPLATADAAGNILSSSDYRPYGVQALGTTEPGPGYTGHITDPGADLVYMQARYYDPVIGHFLSADPSAPSAGNAFAFNRYAYADNNPVLNIDPDGRDSVGEIIDQHAQEASNAGNHVATFGWAFAGEAWGLLGAESVSQVADKGTSAGTGNFVMAAITIGTLGKGEAAADAAKGVEKAAEDVIKGAGRAKNKLAPISEAEGAHSVYKTGPDGKISNTATYQPNAKNPSGFQETKRVDITGKSHTNPDGKIVPTPHVNEAGTRGVRPANPDELPSQ